jgi:hypothetical protein
MSFIKSILFGCEGSYNIFGTSVKYKSDNYNYSLKGAGFISQLASECINNNAFRLLTQSYVQVLVHEMSHVLAGKIFTGKNSNIVLYTNTCSAITSLPREFNELADWKKSVIDIAGPMGSIAFSSCKLMAATALKPHLSWPASLVIGSGAIMWISGELLYASVSASKKDHGDFGCIAQKGNTHLALSTTAILSEVALGIFLAIKLAA